MEKISHRRRPENNGKFIARRGQFSLSSFGASLWPLEMAPRPFSIVEGFLSLSLGEWARKYNTESLGNQAGKMGKKLTRSPRIKKSLGENVCEGLESFW